MLPNRDNREKMIKSVLNRLWALIQRCSELESFQNAFTSHLNVNQFKSVCRIVR